MRLTVEGTTKTIEDWASDYGIPCALIRHRLRQGWSAERAVLEPMPAVRGEKLAPDAMLDSEPVPHQAASWSCISGSTANEPKAQNGSPPELQETRTPGPNGRVYTHNGVSRTLAEWAAHLGITRQAMHLRLKTKGTEAFTRPVPR